VLDRRARVRNVSGAYRHSLIRIAPVLEDGAPVEWVAYVADEHEHAEARARLEEATARLRAIFEHSPVPIAVKDRSGRYLVASESCGRLFGQTAASLIGKTDFDLMPVEIAEALRKSDVDVLTRKSEVVREERLRVGSDVRTFLSSKFPLRDPAGEVVGIGSISVDVTERQLATRQIREAVRRRDEFLAMLSHELRNPLSALVNAFYLMEDGLNPRSASAHRVARRQLAQISRLLDDLLDVARLTKGELEIRREPTGLDDVVRDAVEALEAESQARGVTIEAALPAEKVPVLGDPARLQQACVNLLTNAIRFSPAGGRVRVTLLREPDRAILEVRDEGEGIPVDDLDRIFELFYQREPGLARSRGGLGVGLTLVKKIVERHGGTVSVESPGPGRGATFTIVVPLDLGKHLAVPVVPDRALHIVLVEDNADARDMMRAWLERHGHRVEEAPDGESAIELIQRTQPDMALVDVGLPGLDGYGVARRVREALGKGSILIALTGYGREEDRRAATAAGFDAHLTKPVDPEALVRMLSGLAKPIVGSDRN
jgi:two-component system CheB/CheR fusion protein